MTLLLGLEIAANATLLTAVILAARNHPISWIFGVIGCLLFGIFFYFKTFYAQVALQGFLIATNIIGWVNWRYGGAEQTILPVSRVQPFWNLLLYLPFAAAVAWGYSEILRSFTNASDPLVDSLILTFSIVAQLLLMNRKLETWGFWILVNTVAIPLYLTQDAYVTAFVYGLFWLNAFYGFYVWRGELQKGAA
ncbi:MAG: nicotinamide riboside transporter PnuC [Pseudomonadota bacterium]